jgi:hypothetical protein
VEDILIITVLPSLQDTHLPPRSTRMGLFLRVSSRDRVRPFSSWERDGEWGILEQLEVLLMPLCSALSTTGTLIQSVPQSTFVVCTFCIVIVFSSHISTMHSRALATASRPITMVQYSGVLNSRTIEERLLVGSAPVSILAILVVYWNLATTLRSRSLFFNILASAIQRN